MQTKNENKYEKKTLRKTMRKTCKQYDVDQKCNIRKTFEKYGAKPKQRKNTKQIRKRYEQKMKKYGNVQKQMQKQTKQTGTNLRNKIGRKYNP